MKKLLRKIFGIEEMEKAIAETIQRQMEAEQAIKAAEEEKNRLLKIEIGRASCRERVSSPV